MKMYEKIVDINGLVRQVFCLSHPLSHNLHIKHGVKNRVKEKVERGKTIKKEGERGKREQERRERQKKRGKGDKERDGKKVLTKLFYYKRHKRCVTEPVKFFMERVERQN